MGNNRPTILVCDDSLLVRKKMKDCLSELGDFNIVEAANGQSSVELFKQNDPDLVFLDIVMPDKNGIEALQEMMEVKKDVKVIMLSSSGTKTHLKAAMEAGASDFIQKPWEKSQIEHIVKNIF
ncbi:MAG: response regulator [Clostridiaceae bacterium]|jgi:two-component system chemotaxis response regulator CheY|nr:response regulator [Clostridiaceae bacterium]